MCGWHRLGGGTEGDLQRNILWVLLCQRHGPWHQPRSVFCPHLNANSKTSYAIVAHVKLPSSPGLDVDCTSDVRIRIQQSSYIQEQYVLTRCSLSSERSLQTQSHSHINTSSNSDSAAGAFLPDPHSSAPLLDTGSLPQGLEKVPPAGHRSSLSRWADSAWQQNLSAETSTDNSAEIVRLKVMKSPKSKCQVLNWFQSGTTISLQGKPSLWRKIKNSLSVFSEPVWSTL